MRKWSRHHRRTRPIFQIFLFCKFFTISWLQMHSWVTWEPKICQWISCVLLTIIIQDWICASVLVSSVNKHCSWAVVTLLVARLLEDLLASWVSWQSWGTSWWSLWRQRSGSLQYLPLRRLQLLEKATTRSPNMQIPL